MAANAGHSNISVILDHDHIPPYCRHGPALLFERYNSKQCKNERFFACSACRDRKECSFYLLENDFIQKKKSRTSLQNVYSKNLPSKKLHKRLILYKKLKPQERKYCCDCSTIVFPDELSNHVNHTIHDNITKKQLMYPSYLLSAISNNKTNAQYLFSKSTVEFLKGCIQNLNFHKMLCVGAPRLHEAILNEKSDLSSVLEGDEDMCTNDTGKIEREENEKDCSSLLLDIDERLSQFHAASNFCRYNMFNHHFFENDTDYEVYLKFMQCDANENLILIMDPPFGGLVEVLANNYLKISAQWKELNNSSSELPLFWIFPYFMEAKIMEHLPSMKMMDYKINYENHKYFKDGPSGRKSGSPVRIFTNIDLAEIKLPDCDYRFCAICKRYVQKENKHCEICDKCTSKDGKTYKHCHLCNRCVKPSRFHCTQCQMCVLQDHVCGKPVNLGCHICGDQSHKQKSCPKKRKVFVKKKKKKLSR